MNPIPKPLDAIAITTTLIALALLILPRLAQADSSNSFAKNSNSFAKNSNSFAARYPTFEKMFNDCVFVADKPAATQLVCHPDEVTPTRCQYDYGQKFVHSGFVVNKSDLAWADAVLFSKDAKEPRIYFNMDIPKKSFVNPRGGTTVIVLPETLPGSSKLSCASQNKATDQALAKLARLYERFQRYRDGVTFVDVIQDPQRLVYYLNRERPPECGTDPGGRRFVPIPIMPANLRYAGGGRAKVLDVSTQSLADIEPDSSDDSAPQGSMGVFNDKRIRKQLKKATPEQLDKMLATFQDNWVRVPENGQGTPMFGSPSNGLNFNMAGPLGCAPEDQDCWNIQGAVYSSMFNQILNKTGPGCYRVNSATMSDGVPQFDLRSQDDSVCPPAYPMMSGQGMGMPSTFGNDNSN